MATMTLDTDTIDEFMGMALLDSVQLLQGGIIEITPRDPVRPPKNLNIHVTGDLKRSIDYEQVGQFEYRIGTKQGDAEYGKFLEFGTATMEPRSFLRKGIIDYKDEVIENFSKRFKSLVNGR